MALNVALLFVDTLLMGGVVLALHRLSPRYGLAPLLVFLAGVVAILHSLATASVYIRPIEGVTLVFGSVVIVPAVLLAVLIIYAVDGTAAARVAILGVVGAGVLAVLLHFLRDLHLRLPGGENLANLPADHRVFQRSIPVAVASLTAFLASMSVIAVVCQAFRNHARWVPVWVATGATLLVAAWTDTLVFRFADFGQIGVPTTLWSALLVKTMVMMLVWPLAVSYLTVVAPKMQKYAGRRRRPTLDLLFGTYGRQELLLLETEEARRTSEVGLQRVQDALRLLEHRLHTVVSNSPIVFFALDRDGVFTLSEGAGLEALGLRPGEVVGRSVYEEFPMVEDSVRAVLGGVEEEMVGIVEVGDVAFRTTYRSLKDEAGEIVGLIGVSTNVSGQLRVEDELRASEHRFRSTFEQAAVGIAHISADVAERGRFLRVNRKLCEIVGYSEEELLEKTFEDITHPDDRYRSVSEVGGMLAGEVDVYRVEKRYVRKDGEVVWVHLTVAPARLETGEIAFFLSVIEDITDRRQTEAELRQAQKMEVVGQLTGGVAHDFNNLLTVIVGGLEIGLSDLEDRPETQEALAMALEATKRGASLTQQLLAFSRRQALNPTAVCLKVLLADMHDLLARSLGETITVETGGDEDLAKCVVDRVQMENAVLNLALNARDAMPDGGVLALTTRNAVLDGDSAAAFGVEPGEYVRLEVSDEGEGMPEWARERAFEPFFTTKDVGRGSGLGLSMVYGFVKQSGGGVSIESEAGRGTTVSLVLPRAGDAEPVEEITKPMDAEPRGAGETILLVEDDEGVRALTRSLLTRLGYRALVASDGESALAILESDETIDLLFTDVVLPGGMTGAGVARKADVLRPGLPVLFTSGYSSDVLTYQGRLDSGVEILAKPFRRHELAERLRAALPTPEDGQGLEGC